MDDCEDALQRIAEECLAGRLITRARLCKQVKNALELLEWRKESVKVRPVQLPDGEEQPEGQRALALALTPAGVRGVQELLSTDEPHDSQDFRSEGSTQQQQQQQQRRRRTAARQLLATMLRQSSVRFSPGLPCEAELGEAFPQSASAAEDAALFTLAPLTGAEQALANSSHHTNGENRGFLFAELFAV